MKHDSEGSQAIDLYFCGILLVLCVCTGAYFAICRVWNLMTLPRVFMVGIAAFFAVSGFYRAWRSPAR